MHFAGRLPMFYIQRTGGRNYSAHRIAKRPTPLAGDSQRPLPRQTKASAIYVKLAPMPQGVAAHPCRPDPRQRGPAAA